MTHQPGIALAVGALFALSACSENEFQPPPPPPVEVATPAQRDVIDYVEFSGTTESFEIVEIRARVQGFLQQVAYKEGEPVAENMVMFQIDPAPFVAARDAARARVVQAQAEARLTKTTAERLAIAYEDRAVSEIQLLEAQARAEAMEAAVEVAEKDLAIRELDLSYCTVKSPISGRPSASAFEVGALVGTFTSSTLARVEDSSRIYVWFSVSDRVLLRMLADGRLDAERRVYPEVEIATEADQDFPWRGQVDYADPAVDSQTGTLRVRAVVDSPGQQLVGGLFVRVRLASATLEKALLVPDAAVASDQAGRYVYVVDDENTVVRRAVELGPRDGADRVVTAGITATDRVIVEGLLRARPGGKVTPKSAGS